MVAEGTSMALALPSSWATRSSSARTVGSVRRCSSPSGADSMASRIPRVGCVAVSLNKSTTSSDTPHRYRRKRSLATALGGRALVAARGVFRAQPPGGLDHRLQLAEGHGARQVFHAAVGREDHVLRFDELERALDARHHLLRRLD